MKCNCLVEINSIQFNSIQFNIIKMKHEQRVLNIKSSSNAVEKRTQKTITKALKLLNY